MATETRFRTLVKGYGILQYVAVGASVSPPPSIILPSHPPKAHAGSWSPTVSLLEQKYMTMMKNGTASHTWQPIRDQVFKMQAAEAISWAQGVVSSPQTMLDYPLEDANTYLNVVQTQCRTTADATVNYTPYDPKTRKYKDQDTTEGYLK